MAYLLWLPCTFGGKYATLAKQADVTTLLHAANVDASGFDL